MSQCDSKSGSCSTESHESSYANAENQSCATAKPCCPVEKSVEKWGGAFCDAMHQVQVDILKEKIRKAWGPQLDKAGDAVVEAMGVQWQTTLTQAKARVDLKEAIKGIFFGAKK